MPIFFYLLIFGGWKQFFRELPWIAGIFISLIAPGIWYVSAEIHTPGFLEYFLLGEHIYRFIKPGWTGDLYGNAHIQAHGMILVYALVALLPWPFIFMGRLFQSGQSFITGFKNDRFKVFLGLWLVTQLVFFCLPANIIWPYYLPIAPAFAMLCADQLNWSATINRRIMYSGIGLVVVLLLTTPIYLKRNQKSM